MYKRGDIIEIVDNDRLGFIGVNKGDIFTIEGISSKNEDVTFRDWIEKHFNISNKDTIYRLERFNYWVSDKEIRRWI